MLARRLERRLGTLGILAAMLVLAGCGCTDDALCSLSPGLQQGVSQMGVQSPGGIPLPPGPGPIKPGQGDGPLAVDVMFLMDDASAIPADETAVGLFQAVTDGLLPQLTDVALLGGPDEFDLAFGLSRTAAGADAGPLTSGLWPYFVIQPVAQPGGDWDGTWAPTVLSDESGLAGDAGWREGSLRMVVFLSDLPEEAIPGALGDLPEVDEVAAANPLLGQDAAAVLEDLAQRVGQWQTFDESERGRTAAQKIEDPTNPNILGWAYYRVTYNTSQAPAGLIYSPEPAPIPQPAEEGYRIVSQDGLEQIVRLPLYGEELPENEQPDPLNILWTSSLTREDPNGLGEIRGSLVVRINWEILPQAPDGGQNPTTDTGDADIPASGFSIGFVDILIPAITDPNAEPPIGTVTLTGVEASGEPILFTDAERAAAGGTADPAYPGPYEDENTPVPPGTPSPVPQ